MEHFYIYCIHNDDLPEYYVGHTVNLYDRWHVHKTESKNNNSKVYKYIRDNGKINNFKMEVLYESYCSLQEAIKLERYYKELLGATLNTQVPGRTRKERMVRYGPIYYQKNKEQICEKRKEKFTCICGVTSLGYTKQRHFRTQKHIQFIRENIGY